MSNDLFIDCNKELERMESILRTKKNYYTGFSEHKTAAVGGKEGKIFYNAQIAFTNNDGTTGNFSVDGESFPDLYKKISDKLTNPI